MTIRQNQIETWKEKKNRKLWIFKSLMATRGALISNEHVSALNMIDLEFSDKNKKEREVKESWKGYLNQLASSPAYPKKNDEDLSKYKEDYKKHEEDLKTWSNNNSDHLAKLLQAMGKCVGYDFDIISIKKRIYSPAGHVQDELEERALRTFAIKFLSGENPIRTNTSLIPSDKEAAAFGQKFQEVLSEYIEGKRDLKVTVKKDKSE
ncbi:MAG: hypothetical protein HYU63_07770 [Armatimonadetes bacterium]|nr:hypothetical protein [Armatimonadota bacterium]